ncbi:MAG: RNA-binding protein [Anaerolineaceae bacterium]|nr:RNA-binding protein [Anaerolineaceae bacterium]
MATKLYVGNLPYSATEEQLRTVFAGAGEVVSVQIVTDKFTNKSRGFGFVEMGSQEAANEAIKQFNGYSLNDRNLVVNEARPREERSGGGGGGNRRPRSNYGGGGGGGGDRNGRSDRGGRDRGDRDRY